MLKIYVYGYLNRIHSSRRLERECQRNVELMWLTGRLAPDFKTIANFRKDNGRGVRQVCKEFVVLCRKLNLISQSTVVIDGSKFKGVNNRDRNYTPGKLKRRREELERSIERYFYRLDKMDQKSPEVVEVQASMLKEKIASLKEALVELNALEPELDKAEDKQISLTDPEARSLRTRGTGIVGYNVQSAVEPDNHLIVAHAVTNQFNDHRQLSPMAIAAKEAMGVEELDAVADRGYFKGEEVLACDEAGITVYVPRPRTSNNKAKGLYDKEDFHYIAEDDEYQCPAGERLRRRTNTHDRGKPVARYWTLNCGKCALKPQCTTGKERRISRWEREDPSPRDDATATRHGGTPVWYAKALDGCGALSHERIAQRRYRDEFAGACVQPEARHEHLGCRGAPTGALCTIYCAVFRFEGLYDAIRGNIKSLAHRSSDSEFNLATRQRGLVQPQPTELRGFFFVFPRSVPIAAI